MRMENGKRKRSAFRLYVDYTIPPICPSCRARLPISRPAPFCPHCLEAWENEKRDRCKDCGLSYLDCICLPPLLKEIGIRDGIFLSAYRAGGGAVTDRLIYFVKRERDAFAFDFLARELSRPICTYLRSEEIPVESVYVVPLPRRRSAVRENGFDQAKELAVAITYATGLTYRALFLRRFGGREQKALNARERLLNLKRAFLLKGSPDLSGKTILLVDDVMTTGSGLRVATELLLKRGAARVIPVTVARTIDPL